MKVSLLRTYLDKCHAARAAAAKTQDWERVVAPDPALPLVSAGWENERTDIHGFTSDGWSVDKDRIVTVLLSCYCGHDVAVTAAGAAPADWDAAEDAAFELFVEHARAAALVPAA